MKIASGIIALLALATLQGGLASNASASPKVKKILSGFVVEKIENEIYLSLGARDKVLRWSSVRFKHEIKLKHPVSKETVSDWLPVGSAVVSDVRQELSVAKVSTALSRQIEVGDIAEVLVLVDVAKTEPQPEPKPVARAETVPRVEKEALPTLDPETEAILQLWKTTSGRILSERIALLNAFLRSAPDSPFTTAIQEDLRILYEYQRSLSTDGGRSGPQLSVTLQHETPSSSPAGSDIPLVFVPDVAGDIDKAWLHYRLQGADTFKRRPLRVANGRYLRGEIPADSTQGPAVEYFVDMGTRSGTHGNAVGSPRKPVAIGIDSSDYASPLPSGEGRTRLSLSTIYLDFATFDKRSGDRTDDLVIIEGDILYRLRTVLYGIRTGFGVANGRGGSRDQVNLGEPPLSRYQYGYGELEFRLGRRSAAIGRIVAGSGAEGFALGGKARLRLGAEEDSNLSAGFFALPGLGFLTDIRMQWKAVDALPIGLSVGLTDQPAQGDLGIRLTTDLGWRARSWFQPTLRVSYQGRSVDHSGVGMGLGAVFDW